MTVGMGCDHAHLPVSTINCKEIDLMGSFRYANTVSSAVLIPLLCQLPQPFLIIESFNIRLLWYIIRCRSSGRVRCAL